MKTPPKTVVVQAPIIQNQGAIIPTTEVKGQQDSVSVVPTNTWFHKANQIEIPSINLVARVTYPKDEKETEDFLKNSVVHVFDSALPGGEKPVIISGHSSFKEKVEYSDVFAPITKINIGDSIYLIKDGKPHHYKMTSYSKIPPKDKSLYSLEGERLILVTCWPVGTNLMRYAIIAKKVD